MKSRGMKYQSLHSPILQKMLKYLSDCQPHTGINVMFDTKDCGWRATISALRKHGFNIKCTYKGLTESKRRVHEYQLIKH